MPSDNAMKLAGEIVQRSMKDGQIMYATDMATLIDEHVKGLREAANYWEPEAARGWQPKEPTDAK